MKRRHFIRGIGLGSAAVATSLPLSAGTRHPYNTLEDYSYGGFSSISEALSSEGLLILRLEFAEEPVSGPLTDLIRVRKAKLGRIRSYFQDRILVLWLADPTLKTELTIGRKEKFSFTLGELVETLQLEAGVDGIQMKINILLDKEIGEIDPASVGINMPGDEFSFVALADPQGGNPDDKDGLKTRMKIHNAFIQESVDLAGRLEFHPAFAMIIGDVCDDWGYKKDLVQMNSFLSELPCPVLYGIGNHETLLRSQFGPGYNMEAFSHYFAAQKAMNGLEKLLYSFNLGRWHFVVWPDPLRDNFWETHPHYFDWLERDLEKHKERPCMVFQHVPAHPIGITPHINYAESVDVKRTFLDILARQGNVKYALSGHVHIPVKASFKTAVTYRGIRMISLPAAGYRPRAFGEEDFYGGPSQGIALIHINGESATIQFKTVTEELYTYPLQLPEFDKEAFPLWLSEKWELPAATNFINPDFQNGLKGWAKRYVYTEDVHPSNLRESRPAPEREGTALYLFCKRRGYQAPGQDRLPQDINRISQALEIGKGVRPVIRFNYRIDATNTDPKGFAGGYLLAEGFSGNNMLHKIIYSAGKIWVNNWGARNQNKEVPCHHYALSPIANSWQDTTLNIAEDFESVSPGINYSDLNIDRLVLTLGVWNINDGDEQPFGIYFTDFRLELNQSGPSNIGGEAIREKPEKDIWWQNKIWPNANMAGEHRYIIATQDPEE